MTSYGPFTDANGDLSLLRIPILFVASLPGSGLAPGIFYYQASDKGYYYWNGTSFVGPLGAGGGGGGGAPVGAQYVVMALDGTLTGERRLQVGAALSLVDGGANADVTLDRAALTGDVTAPAGSNATTIANNAVSNAKLRDSNALSVIGRASNTTGDPADIAAGTDAHVLRRSGTTLGFGQVATDGLADDAVTFAKFQNVNTNRLIGRDAAGVGDVTEIECSGLLEFNTFNAIRIQPNSTHGIIAANPSTGFAEWRTPANYPCYPLFRDASGQLIYPKISGGSPFPGSPVDGQVYTRTDHGNTTYYYDSTRAGWLGPPTTIWFGYIADVLTTVYLNWSPSTTAFMDTFGPIFGYPVRVTAMGLYMQASGTGTVTVHGSGTAVTGADLALSAQISKTDHAMNSNTISAGTYLGVKRTSGTIEGPGMGYFEVRRFET